MKPSALTFSFLAIVGLVTEATAGGVLRVGPARPYQSIAQAIAASSDGDLVLVDPGVYSHIAIVGKAITIASAGGPTQRIVLAPPTSIPAIFVAGLVAGQSVTLQHVQIPCADPTTNAIRAVGSPQGALRLLDVHVEPVLDYLAVGMRALVEVDDVGTLFCDGFSVAWTGTRRGYRSVADPTPNRGLSALAAGTSKLVLRHVRLQGFDNPLAGPTEFGGDALRLRDGAFAHLQQDVAAGNLLVGGSGTLGGSAVHAVGASLPFVRHCGFTTYSPGRGTLSPGGEFAFQNDRGVVGTGLGRTVVACVLESFGVVSAQQRVVQQGTLLTFTVDSGFPRAFALFAATRTAWFTFPGVEGVGILDYADPGTLAVGAGTLTGTSVTLPVTVPIDPALSGLQIAVQALLGPPQGQSAPVLSFGHGTALVLE